jgi:hypothetical protein
MKKQQWVFFFRNLTCQKTLVLRNNRNIQIVYCQIDPHKHSQRAADLIFTAILVFLLEKSVNLPLNFNTLSLLRVTSVTGAVSPAVDVNQLLSINEVGSCVFLCIAGSISTCRHHSACLSRAEPTEGREVSRFRKKLIHLEYLWSSSLSSSSFIYAVTSPRTSCVRLLSDVQLLHTSKTGVQCHSLSGWG